MRFEHTIDIAAPVGRVWELTVDIASLPEVTPTIATAERLDEGLVTVGSQARLKQPGQRARVWTVTAVEEGRRFAWTTRAMGVTMTGVHELEAQGQGTANTLAVELEGRLAPIVALLIGLPVRRALAAENAGFKETAER